MGGSPSCPSCLGTYTSVCSQQVGRTTPTLSGFQPPGGPGWEGSRLGRQACRHLSLLEPEQTGPGLGG